VPVQYSYTSTPLSACTVQLYLYSPQCLYSTAIPLLPLWAVRPVQSLSACTTVHFTLTFTLYAVQKSSGDHAPPPHLLSETTVFGGFSQNLQTKVWYILQFGLLPATIDAYVERNLHGHCPHLSVEFGETCHSTSPRNAIDSMRVTLKL